MRARGAESVDVHIRPLSSSTSTRKRAVVGLAEDPMWQDLRTDLWTELSPVGWILPTTHLLGSVARPLRRTFRRGFGGRVSAARFIILASKPRSQPLAVQITDEGVPGSISAPSKSSITITKTVKLAARNRIARIRTPNPFSDGEIKREKKAAGPNPARWNAAF